MIAAHVDLIQWRSRERYIKLLLQTHSPEVDYSLLIMVMRSLILEGQRSLLGQQWRRVALLWWLILTEFRCFWSTRRLRHEIPRSPLYMGVLGQGNHLGALMDGWGGSGSPRPLVARLGGWARHLVRIPPPWSVYFVPKSRIVIFWKILILEKSPVNLSPYRSLKPKKKYTKQGFLTPQSYNQNKGDS